MVHLNPEVSFTPLLEEEFGKENVIIVKDAKGSQPIRRWYKNWKPLVGDEPKVRPELYDVLINKVYSAIVNENIATITFIWMQGERDAREKQREV